VTVLTVALRKERDNLYKAEGDIRWALGDWAIEVAGLPGEVGASDGSLVKLEAARTEGLEPNNDLLVCAPSIERLRDYRYAAAAIPVDLRMTVRSVDAGRLLWQKVKDDTDRRDLIRKLRGRKGIVTVDAVRAHFGQTPTREPETPPEVKRAKSKVATTPEEKEAADRIKAAKEKATLKAAEGQTISAHFWRIVQKLDDWRRDMTVMDEELVSLTADEKVKVAEGAQALADQALRWVAICKGQDVGDDGVIDGTARSIPTPQLAA
jgi:hypothetical protein